MPLVLNIGLESRSGTVVSPQKVVAQFNELDRILDLRLLESNTERTLVVKLADLETISIGALAESLDQECIAWAEGDDVLDLRVGLDGPHADRWGAFNPEFFLLCDGRTLAQAQSEAFEALQAQFQAIPVVDVPMVAA